ncbi:MAG TPA: rod shape-determining protein MreC [Rhizomicrobium sp.]|nr:rod shape-determining protein MreC [Rhizomicrobium sp.]
MSSNSWKIARRSNTQLPLVIVLALAVVLVLLGRAQASLFDRARMRMTDLMAPVLETVHKPVQGFNRWIGSIEELFSVYQENLALKDENARLKQWRNVAVVMQGRVQHYQELLHAVPDPAVDSVLARVIGRASRPFLETMILDAGEGSNVKPGEAVVDARGMIGRIYLAGDHTSWVILLTDLNSRIPVTIASADGKPTALQAIMTGDNSAAPMLDTLSQSVTLRAGDQVVSSGDGGLLPPGLPIGTVMGGPGAYRVALLADASSSEDVEVLAFRHPAETLPPTTPSQLPAVAAGLPPATATPATVPAAAGTAAPHTASAAAGPVSPPKTPLPQMPRAAPNISAAIQQEPIQTPAEAPDNRDD